MKVSKVSLYGQEEDDQRGRSRILSRANVIIEDSLMLRSIYVYRGSAGLFVSYPEDPANTPDFYMQLFHPLSKELRSHIEEEVLKEYFCYLLGTEDLPLKHLHLKNDPKYKHDIKYLNLAFQYLMSKED